MRPAPVLLLVCVLISPAGCGPAPPPRVVVSCAQDREFAEKLFAGFTAGTGIPVVPTYDTESEKSVSLYTQLVSEGRRPRTDVFWNNEILSTIRLARRGLLQPYDCTAAAGFPASAKAPDRAWYAFAARARVLIVNTTLVPAADRPASLFDLTRRWRGRIAMAKPQFGTSATQAACLFQTLGPEAGRKFYHDLDANGVHVVSGNKQVAEGVGRGEFAVGVTDTDDAVAEVEAGRPVTIVFPDRDGHPGHPRMGTLFIPNTLSILASDPNPPAARRLVEFLLSPDVEAALAAGESHQFPLNPGVKAALPAAFTPGLTAKRMDVDWSAAADLWDEVQAFLRDEFARPGR